VGSSSLLLFSSSLNRLRRKERREKKGERREERRKEKGEKREERRKERREKIYLH
jgi:hypothetical protein